MKTVRVLYHLARADFLERVRRYAFLVTLAGSVYLGYAVLVGDMTLSTGGYRGIYNSAWVGLQMAMTTAFFVSLVGFYIVKNTVDRDIQTGVGQILATTPITKLDYVLGKALSNFAVLTVIVALLAVAAMLGQLWGGEDTHLRLWPLLAPFLFITLPALAFVAALAVLFETVPWLRGGVGNIAYFILYMFLLVFGLEKHSAFFDFAGLDWLDANLAPWLYAQVPGYQGGISLGDMGKDIHKTFLWTGFDWKIGMLSQRLYWFAVALALVLIAALLFDRFDPARGIFGNRRQRAARALSAPFRRWWSRVTSSALSPTNGIANGSSTSNSLPRLSALPPSAIRFRSADVLLAELRLMLKRQRWWWYAGAAILLCVSLADSAAEGRQGVLPFVWIWPALLWSAMGTRETRHGTDQFIYSSAHSLRRQFVAAWLAGVLVAVLTGFGVCLRILIASDWVALLGFGVGALFIPTLALTMGVWSGTSKLFEAVYVIWWYVGPIHHDRKLDFMFTAESSLSPGILRFYLAATLVLFGLALLGRRYRLRS